MQKNKLKTEQAFFALTRAGLWETGVSLKEYGEIDFAAVLRLAEEQSVVGLITAGLENVHDTKVPQEWKLQFVGATLQLEQRNMLLNEFIEKLIKRLYGVGIKALLVKGQGVAQCYERPCWRTAGDVDLLLDDQNYEKAKSELFPIAYDIGNENNSMKHQAMKIMGIDVELHGRMSIVCSRRADKTIDKVISDSLSGATTTWKNGKTDVLLPDPNNHVFLIFTHFLHHFFVEGVGLRQICDWCRILWTYRTEIDRQLLEKRLSEAGLISEWRAFAALAVNHLGMPLEAMPMYEPKYKTRASRVLASIMKAGNFGHNKDLSYRSRFQGVSYKMVSFSRRFIDFTKFVPIFPLDAPSFFVTYVTSRVKE